MVNADPGFRAGCVSFCFFPKAARNGGFTVYWVSRGCSFTDISSRNQEIPVAREHNKAETGNTSVS